MSGTVKVTQVKLGDSADPTKNFQINVPAVPDGTLTIERGDGTDVMKFLANGGVDMPSLPFSKTANGYMKLPNGFIVQWGAVDLAANGVQTDIPLPIAWSVGLLGASISLYGPSPAGAVSIAPATGLPLTYLFGYNSNTSVRTAYWIAIGY